MNHMRELLNATDWVIQSDRQAEREILSGQCVQMTVHFFGTDAHRLAARFDLGIISKIQMIVKTQFPFTLPHVSLLYADGKSSLEISLDSAVSGNKLQVGCS